jgi:hypothetical protein
LWRHRDATFNPRYGAFGLLAMPYFVFLEFLGPVVETLGVSLTIVAFIVGDLSGASFVGFLVLLENLGYHQLNDLWRMIAFVDLASRKQGWGAQKRRGIGNLSTAEAPAHQPLTKSQ